MRDLTVAVTYSDAQLSTNMTDDTASDPVTADDTDLPVLDSEGNQIGVVAAVSGEDVVVDPGPDVSDDARASLGWSSSENVEWTLQRSDLERVAAEDVLETFPKSALDHDSDDPDPSGPVLRVDLAEINRRG